MSKLFRLLLIALTLGVSTHAEAAPAQGYIVVFNDDVKSVPDNASDMARAHAFRVDRTYSKALKGFAARIPDAALAKVKADKRVKYVEVDVKAFAFARGGRKPKPPAAVCGDGSCNGTETCSSCPGDCGACPPPPPAPVCGDGVCNGTETCSTCAGDCGACPPPPPTPTGCAAEPAQTIPYGTKRVGGGITMSAKTAWVIDSGIDLDHCDLNVDANRSANFVYGETSPDDKNGHGTHVAGTIAAKNNTIGTVGVAPGTLVVAIRALDSSGSGSLSWILGGIDYITGKAAPGDVVNMSLGFAGSSQSLTDAITRSANLGILYSISAGNSSVLATGYAPASVNHANVYTVSAVDSGDRFASFSNYGNPPVDFAAPGVSISSSKMGGGITVMSGTSMAAPHVAGLLLLGVITTSGYALNDPDGKPDPIAHH